MGGMMAASLMVAGFDELGLSEDANGVLLKMWEFPAFCHVT